MTETPAPQAEGAPERRAPGAPPARAPLRLVVMADDLLMARGLAALLERSGSVQAMCVESVEELGQALERRPARVVLWFAEHADSDRLTELSRLRETCGVSVCVAAETVDFRTLRDAYRDQAEGLAVLLRRTRLDVSDLCRVIVQLVTGRVVLSPAVLEQLVIDSRAVTEHALSRLTTYELAVLELLAMGLRNRAIAARLGRSEKLVEKHVGRIFAKLGLESGDHPDIDRRVRAARMFLFAQGDGELAAPGEAESEDSRLLTTPA